MATLRKTLKTILATSGLGLLRFSMVSVKDLHEGRHNRKAPRQRNLRISVPRLLLKRNSLRKADFGSKYEPPRHVSGTWAERERRNRQCASPSGSSALRQV